MAHDPGSNSVANLAAFVASTIGSVGEVHRGRDVFCVASSVPIANGFVNVAAVIDPDADRSAAVDQAIEFFQDRTTPFVVWVPGSDGALRDAIFSAGGAIDHEATPDMIIENRIDSASTFDVRVVTSEEEFEICATLAEEGYGIEGMAWLMGHHRMNLATDVIWTVAYADAEPMGVGCGFTSGSEGGVYYVATPPRNARRGVAAAVTASIVNRLMDGGCTSVALQASEVGFPVYERLGFHVQGHLERYRFDVAALDQQRTR